MFSTVLLFREALYGALVIALACSVIGVYVVLRRIVFVGAALAQISSAGIALALWLAGAGIALGPLGHPTVMSLLLTLIAVMFFASGARGRVPPDATIGVTYAVAAALGILLIAKAASGEAHDIFLSGNILGITRSDTLVLLGVAVPVLLVHFVFKLPSGPGRSGFLLPAGSLVAMWMGVAIMSALMGLYTSRDALSGTPLEVLRENTG